MTVKASWDVVSELMGEAYFAHVDCFTPTPFYDSLEEAPPLPDYTFTVIHMDDDTNPSWEE